MALHEQPCFHVSYKLFPSDHHPQVFAEIQLEVKGDEILNSASQPQHLFGSGKSALIQAQRRENKLPPLYDE